MSAKTKFIDNNELEINKLGYSAEDIWKWYHRDVKPYLAVITSFRLGETKTTYAQIRLGLGISNPLWKVYKKYFPQLRKALKAKESVMEFKAQIDLQKHLVNTEYKNPKGIEMQGLRYDKNWKTKNDKAEVDMPTTIEVVISDKKLSDKDREDKAQVKVE